MNKYIFIQGAQNESSGEAEAYWSDSEEALNIYMNFKLDAFNLTPGKSIRIEPATPPTALDFIEEIQEYYDEWYADLDDGDRDNHLEAEKYRKMIEELYMVDTAQKSVVKAGYLVECIEEPMGSLGLEGYNIGDQYKCQEMVGPFGHKEHRQIQTYYRFYPGNDPDGYYETTSYFPRKYFKKVGV